MLMQRNAHKQRSLLSQIRSYEMEIVDDAMWKRQREYTPLRKCSLIIVLFFHISVCAFGSVLSHSHLSLVHTHRRNGFFLGESICQCYTAWQREYLFSRDESFRLHTYTKCESVYACVRRVFGENCLWCLWHSHEERVLCKLCWEIARVR